MAKKHQYPISKIIATGLGAVFIGSEALQNAEYFAGLYGTWWSSMIVIVAVATIGGAGSLPFAERAVKRRQVAWAVCLWLTFFSAAVVSLAVSHIRLNDRRSGEVALAQSSDERVKLAREALADAKATKEAECSKRGSKCRAAEEAVNQARKSLSEKPAEHGEEGQSKQLGAVVVMYGVPLLQLFGGLALLGWGLSPWRSEPVDPEKAQPKKQRQSRKRYKTAINPEGNVIRLQTRSR